jgi:hypothetical protein
MSITVKYALRKLKWLKKKCNGLKIKDLQCQKFASNVRDQRNTD